MISNRKMNVVKRIAFVANDNNRKSLIEWSYYNQEILKNHELIATGVMADILEGTVGVPVTKLQNSASAANHQLAAMIADQQIDILLFFWDLVLFNFCNLIVFFYYCILTTSTTGLRFFFSLCMYTLITLFIF